MIRKFVDCPIKKKLCLTDNCYACKHAEPGCLSMGLIKCEEKRDECNIMYMPCTLSNKDIR